MLAPLNTEGGTPSTVMTEAMGKMKDVSLSGPACKVRSLGTPSKMVLTPRDQTRKNLTSQDR
ncbi:MAG TPA: hypothetical protein PLA87_03090 [Pseudomonadota bacterium]|nr:hypothetical protein [Pseudomonadota bacterium]